MPTTTNPTDEWTEHQADIYDNHLTLEVTVRRPVGTTDDDWELYTVRVPSSINADAPSVDISDWLERVAPDTCDRLTQAAIASAISHDDDAAADDYWEAHGSLEDPDD